VQFSETPHILLDRPVAGTYHRFNRFRTNALGVPVPQVIVSSQVQDDVMLDGVALPAAFDVVAIIIIDGIILLTGGT
jgi:hypothetical protein